MNLNETTHSPIFTNTFPYADCVDAIYECASAAWISTDAAINEVNRGELSAFIQSALELAEVCAVAARTLVAQDQFTSIEIQDCLRECAAKATRCHSECQQHISAFEHCFILSKCSERCAELCQKYLS